MKCICGKEFESKRSTAKYCSAKCRVYASRSVTDSVTGSSLSVTENPLSVTPKSISVTNDVTVNKLCTDCSSALVLEIKRLKAEISLLRLAAGKKVEPKLVCPEELPTSGLPKYKPLGNNYKPNSLYGA